ncbi:hypothetical protein AQB9606_04644 [Aquabacterium sp. CECT 9606]|nr:hypothetical protein AQB9606_04644 [Aquabacterium sp. CECT 9606]
MRRWLAGLLWWRSSAARRTALRCSPGAGIVRNSPSAQTTDDPFPPRAPLLNAPEVALPATASSLITSLMAWHEKNRAAPPAGRGKKDWGGLRRGAWLGACDVCAEVGTRSVHRQLTGRGCLNEAANGREESSTAPPRREHRKAVPHRGTTKLKPCRRPHQSPRPALIQKAKACEQQWLRTPNPSATLA